MTNCFLNFSDFFCLFGLVLGGFFLVGLGAF